MYQDSPLSFTSVVQVKDKDLYGFVSISSKESQNKVENKVLKFSLVLLLDWLLTKASESKTTAVWTELDLLILFPAPINITTPIFYHNTFSHLSCSVSLCFQYVW